MRYDFNDPATKSRAQIYELRYMLVSLRASLLDQKRQHLRYLFEGMIAGVLKSPFAVQNPPAPLPDTFEDCDREWRFMAEDDFYKQWISFCFNRDVVEPGYSNKDCVPSTSLDL